MKPSFWVAMAAYAVLGLVIFFTVTDSRIQIAGLILLAAFALKTWIARAAGW